MEDADMGYGMTTNGLLTCGCSDMASDAEFVLFRAMVGYLIELEKEENSPYNTDGIVNVALIIQDNFSKSKLHYALIKYLSEFIPRFSKYIDSAKSQKFEDQSDIDNNNKHIIAFKDILDNLIKIHKRNKDKQMEDVND